MKHIKMLKTVIYSRNNLLIKQLAFLLLIIFITACTHAHVMKIEDFKGETKEITHTNGLTIILPKPYKCDEFKNGFIIDDGLPVRNPLQININLVTDSNKPFGDWTENIQLNNTLVWYRQSQATGGSATDYIITGWKPISNGYIMFQASKQTEFIDGNPSLDFFGNTWLVIEKAYVKKPLNESETK